MLDKIKKLQVQVEAYDQLVERQKPLSEELIDSGRLGTVGKVARFILDSSTGGRSIELALGAAISLVGAVKGHRVQTRSGLRTNTYCVGIASTGYGKDRSLACLPVILNYTSLANIMMGEPSSDRGLFDRLRLNNGRGLIVWDEAGHGFAGLGKSNQKSYEEAITPMLMKLFSRAGGVFLGTEVANRESKALNNSIDQPHLNIWAVSTPDKLFASLDGGRLTDGLVGRLLFFSPEISGEEPVEVHYSEISSLASVPTSILDDIDLINKDVLPGNLSAIIPDPRIVELSASAREELDILWNAVPVLSKGNPEIWARAVEHAWKLSLIFEHPAATVISGSTMRVAVDVVFARLRWIGREFKRRVSDSKHEADVKLIKHFIESKGTLGAKKSEICRKFRQFKSRELLEILESLQESEEIFKAFQENGKGRRAEVFYSCDVVETRLV